MAWRDNGGKTQLAAVSSDLTGVEDAGTTLAAAMNASTDLSGPESALQSAAVSLQSDAQAAEADLPPACIPGVRRAYGAALTDYSKAAADYQNGVSELGSGSYDVATGGRPGRQRGGDCGDREAGNCGNGPERIQQQLACLAGDLRRACALSAISM